MDIYEYRNLIDKFDGTITALLEARMDLAGHIARYKHEHGLPILDADREALKLDMVREACRPETAEYIAGVFSAIMAASRAYQAFYMAQLDGE